MISTLFRLRPRLWGLIMSATAIVCVCTVAGFLGALWWPFDLTANFRVQYLICLGLAAVILGIGKKWLWAGVSVAFALVNFVEVLPSFIPPRGQAFGSSRTVRILLANVLTSNKQYESVRELIRSVEPDIMALLEPSEAWMKELASIEERYPHFVSRSRDDNFGIALFSRFPFVESKIIEIGDARVPTAVVRVRVGDDELTVIATHPLPPMRGTTARLRNRHLEAVAEYVRSTKGPLIVVGDLNTTPWSPHFNRLLRRTGLRDSRRGRGIQPSWPARLPWVLRIPLDHLLHSPEIRIHGRRLGPRIGSDHLPVVLDLSLRGG